MNIAALTAIRFEAGEGAEGEGGEGENEKGGKQKAEDGDEEFLLDGFWFEGWCGARGNGIRVTSYEARVEDGDGEGAEELDDGKKGGEG